MPRVAFTGHLRRYMKLSTMEVAGETVRSALGAVFEQEPRLRGYVVDDQGELRRHVVVFVNDRRAGLSEQVATADDIFVLQALSGG